MSQASPELFFPISVWNSGGKARAPMLSRITEDSRALWRRDLIEIRDLGFNTVRTWIPWAHCEPREGEFDFENLALMLDLAQEVGLRVTLQVYAESTPHWLEEKYPGASFVAQSGERLESQSVPGLCTDHAGVQEAMLNFYRAAARLVTNHPAFFSWDLWSEPHIVNWTILSHIPNVHFCHCECTRRRFQDWLRNRYETLEALADAWGRAYEGWEQIRPPRFGTILSCTDFIDWKRFIYNKMAEDLKTRADAVREIDGTHLITSHAAVPSGMTSPLSEWGGYGATDDFLMARSVDQYGLSLYPKHSFPERHWEPWKIEFALNLAQSANRRHGGFTVGELQAGFGTRGLVVGDPITPVDHRRWMWSAIARGAKSIHLFAYHPMTSGYESGGYGLIHPDGQRTDRAEEAGRIARVVTEHMTTFAASRPVPAQVAIVYNPLAQLVGGEQACGSHLLHPDSLIGYQRTFANRNIPVDFIHRTDLESGDLSGHRLIIVPHPIMLTGAAAEGLRRYVKSGGHVLAEARLAWNDEHGHLTDAIPGLGLSRVFGATEASVRSVDQVDIIAQDCSHPVMRGFHPGGVMTGAHFAEGLAPRAGCDAQVLMAFGDGTPAVIASQFGKGQTLLVGSFLGLAQRQAPKPNRTRFMLNCLDWAGVELPFGPPSAEPAPVAMHLHTVPGGQLLFLINRTTEAHTVSIELDAEEGRDLITSETVSLVDDIAVDGDQVKVIELKE